MVRIENPRPRRVAALALTLVLATTGSVAIAQSGAGAPAPSGVSQGATHARAMHDGHGDPLMGTLWHVKSALALDAGQQAQWDNAVAQTRAARAQGKTLRDGVKSSYDAEIAKDQPDLAAVAAAADQAREQGAGLRRSVRDAWLNVYAALTPSQKAIVAEALRARAEEADARRAQHRGQS